MSNYYHCYRCGYHREFTDKEASNDSFCLHIRTQHQITHADYYPEE